MSYLFFISFWGLLGIYFFWRRKEFSNLFKALVLVRILFSALFIYVYSYHYSGDLSQYLSIATEFSAGTFSQVFIEDFGLSEGQLLQPRLVFFAKLFFVFYEASFGNVYLVSLLFSLIGSALILEGYLILKAKEFHLANAFLVAWFLPTLLFWTSGISKETIAVGAFSYVLISGYFFIKEGRYTFYQLVLLAFCVFMILQLRYFYVPFLLVILWLFVLEKYRNKIIFWVFSVFGFVAYFVFQKFLIPQLRFQILNDLIYQNYHIMKEMSTEGSYVSLAFENSSFKSIIMVFLQSAKGVFFFSFKNVLMGLVSIENALLLVLLLSSLLKKRTILFNPTWFFYFLSFLLMAGFFTIVSPNYGSLTRYRTVYWVFMVWFLVYQQKSLLKLEGFNKLNSFRFG